MNNYRLVWFAITLAAMALINSAIIGFFGLHSHDGFLKIDANNTTTIMPWNDGGTTIWIPEEGGLGSFQFYNLPDGISSETLAWSDTTYSKTVPFEQGMTLFQSSQYSIL